MRQSQSDRTSTANRTALQAVLADLRQNGARSDSYGGDLADGAVRSPTEIVDQIRDSAGKRALGNTDESSLGRSLDEFSYSGHARCESACISLSDARIGLCGPANRARTEGVRAADRRTVKQWIAAAATTHADSWSLSASRSLLASTESLRSVPVLP